MLVPLTNTDLLYSELEGYAVPLRNELCSRIAAWSVYA